MEVWVRGCIIILKSKFGSVLAEYLDYSWRVLEKFKKLALGCKTQTC
jgi:hypothetical protein